MLMRHLFGKLREELINKGRVLIWDQDAFGSAQHIKDYQDDEISFLGSVGKRQPMAKR